MKRSVALEVTLSADSVATQKLTGIIGFSWQYCVDAATKLAKATAWRREAAGLNFIFTSDLGVWFQIGVSWGQIQYC
jgi:hypothetical protein